MMAPAKAHPFLDWHWLATYALGVVILLIGSWAQDLEATQATQDREIISLRLQAATRDEQISAINTMLRRLEAGQEAIIGRLDEVPPCR